YWAVSDVAAVADNRAGRRPRSRENRLRPVHILAGGDWTAWLGGEDSNSEMSCQNIPFKGRTDFRESSRIPAPEAIRVRARRWEQQLGASAKVDISRSCVRLSSSDYCKPEKTVTRSSKRARPISSAPR